MTALERMPLIDKRHPDLDRILADIPNLGDEALIDGLMFWIGVSAVCVRITSAYVAELEKRGADLSKVNPILMQYYRLVARGTLLPEMVEKFHSRLNILTKSRTYSIEDQRKLLADDCRLPVVVPGADEASEHLMIALDKLTPQQIKQVFGDVGIRSPAGQLVWIRDKSKPRTGAKISVVFDETENHDLEREAKRRKMTPTALIRDMLIANGIIKRKKS